MMTLLVYEFAAFSCFLFLGRAALKDDILYEVLLTKFWLETVANR